MLAPTSGPVPSLTPAQKRAGLVLSSSANASPSTQKRAGLISSSSATASLSTPGPLWPEPEAEAPNRPQKQNRKRILLISACLGITAIIAIAVGLGVHFGTRRNTSTSTSDSNSNNNNKPPTIDDGSAQYDPNIDPSIFTKDPKLKNSFYGVGYTWWDSPYNRSCTQTLADTIKDMQLLSQITTRIRLYSSICNQTALVLEAIKRTKTNLKIIPAILVVDNDEEGYQRQKTALQQTLQTYGRDNIHGIIVGDQFMYNTLQHNLTNVNSTAGLVASAVLKTRVADIRQMLTNMNINTPVGTSDSSDYFNNDLLGALDFGLSSVRPWYASSSVQDAATWAFDFFKRTNVDVANALPNKPQMYITDIGWPTFSSTDSSKTNGGASEASEPNAQLFINNFVCPANTQGVKYFFFEFTDTPWKGQLYPGVEGFTGLFNSNKTLKALTLPDCSHD